MFDFLRSTANIERRKAFKNMKPKLKEVIKLKQTAKKEKEIADATAASSAAAAAAANEAAKKLQLNEPKGGRKRRKSRKVKKSRKHRGGKKTKQRPVLVDAYCRRSR